MIVGNRKWLSVWWSVLISQKYLAMINIFQISHIQGNKVFLDTDIWLLMESWFLLSETFYWFIYIEIITYTYQNSMKWEETITTTFKTKLCVVSREYFVNMRKLHLLTKIHHHTLYHVSGVVVRSRRTVLRRPRTSNAVLRRRRTQVLSWRASTYDGVRRRRTRFIIVGLCDYRFLSQDYLEQRRTGPTTAYVDVRRRRTLRESWVQS